MLKKTVIIHQPDFLSYLGFFHRMLSADLFIILDNVQYVNGTSKSWMNRDIIKTPHGKQWLTVSIQKSPLGKKINEILLSKNVEWKRKNLNLIKENYRHAPFFGQIFPLLEQLYDFECEYLIEFNIKSIQLLMELFDIQIKTICASSLQAQGNNNQLLIDILKKVGATTYLSGVGARPYYDPHPFTEANIEVIWQDFKHPEYPQLHEGFIPYLSSIDLLFNCGINKSREILRSCS
jgi:hypothetical protein